MAKTKTVKKSVKKSTKKTVSKVTVTEMADRGQSSIIAEIIRLKIKNTLGLVWGKK